MHRCLKCGRTVASVNEIAEGCPCGSKVFVFSRLEGEVGDSGSIALLPHLNGKEVPAVRNGHPPVENGHPLDNGHPPTASNDHPPAENGHPDSGKIEEKSPAPAVDAPNASAPLSPAPNPSVPSSSEPLQPSSSHLSPLSSSVASAIIQDEEPADPTQPYSEVWLSKGGSVEALEQPAPIQSVGAVAASCAGQDGVANVRQRQTGVYEIDVGRLRGEPLVIEDAQGIYYVRLPFVPLGETAPGETEGVPAPKNKN
jgi:predicted  nucleic acid-binding Zn-ribbon protein